MYLWPKSAKEAESDGGSQDQGDQLVRLLQLLVTAGYSVVIVVVSYGLAMLADAHFEKVARALTALRLQRDPKKELRPIERTSARRPDIMDAILNLYFVGMLGLFFSVMDVWLEGNVSEPTGFFSPVFSFIVLFFLAFLSVGQVVAAYAFRLGKFGRNHLISSPRERQHRRKYLVWKVASIVGGLVLCLGVWIYLGLFVLDLLVAETG